MKLCILVIYSMAITNLMGTTYTEHSLLIIHETSLPYLNLKLILTPPLSLN